MPLENIQKSVDYIRSKTQIKPSIGITLGSGLAHFVNNIEVEASIPYENIPGFFPPKVDGHPGQLVFGKIGNNDVAVLQGRIHYYEGHTPHEVVHPTRVLAQLGVKNLIITNAAGGLTKEITPGSFVLLRDQINMTGYSPLRGKNFEELGPRFPDMSEPFCKTLTDKMEKILKSKNIPYMNGTYCGVQGPAYETAAEVKMLHALGGTCVGMSTVPEVIAAKHMGLNIVGVSCVTNLGTGLSDAPLNHADVKEVAQRVEQQFSEFLSDFIREL